MKTDQQLVRIVVAHLYLDLKAQQVLEVGCSQATSELNMMQFSPLPSAMAHLPRLSVPPPEPLETEKMPEQGRSSLDDLWMESL